jgi:hypothetical protein
MLYLRRLCTVVIGVALAQSVTARLAAQQNSAAADDDDDDRDARAVPAKESSSLPPQTPVITISGLCKGNAERAGTKPSGAQNGRKTACESVVTRTEFEELADAFQPGMSVEKRRQFGDAYAKAQVMSAEAVRLGLDKTEHFEELLNFVRAQILSQDLERHLEAKAAQVPSRDILDYYRDNPARFERATFQRIFIPHRRQIPADGSRGAASASAGVSATDPMELEAESLRQRAGDGKDFDQLQQEAFALGGLKGTAPTSMGAVRRGSLPPAHSAVFDLKPGEISQVITDSAGFYVYKMISKETLPLEVVKQEVSEILQHQRMKKFEEKVVDASAIRLNDAYFAPSEAPSKPSAGSDGEQRENHAQAQKQ